MRAAAIMIVLVTLAAGCAAPRDGGARPPPISQASHGTTPDSTMSGASPAPANGTATAPRARAHLSHAEGKASYLLTIRTGDNSYLVNDPEPAADVPQGAETARIVLSWTPASPTNLNVLFSVGGVPFAGQSPLSVEVRLPKNMTSLSMSIEPGDSIGVMTPQDFQWAADFFS